VSADKPQALVRRLVDMEWEGWPLAEAAERGAVTWKDLLGGQGPGGPNMVMGVARVRCGESLKAHRHSEPEIYYTLSGRGVVTVESQAIPVEAGTAIYIPGDAEHQIDNAEAEDLLILYTFAVKDWSEVHYRFSPEKSSPAQAST
jgi:quercetin dioxygenase-like cupin family protein